MKISFDHFIKYLEDKYMALFESPSESTPEDLRELRNEINTRDLLPSKEEIDELYG